MIIYKKGDLLEATENIIAHGCNCSGGFGSGVAGQIAKKWPVAKDYYLASHVDGYGLGSVQMVPIGTNKWVANCRTQKAYLPRGICHADYSAIESAMMSLREYAETFNNSSIAIPKIGAGLAGGDWAIIERIINYIFDNYDITVYEL